MAVSKIPDNLIPDLCRMSAEGKRIAEITSWLKNVHGIEVTDAAVSKRIKNVREERAPMVHAIVAEKLSRTVAEDLDAVSAAIMRALEDELENRQVARSGNPEVAETLGIDFNKNYEVGTELWAKTMHVVRTSRGDLMHLLELRLKLAGADDGKGKKADPAEVRDRLMSKVDQLLKNHGHTPEVAITPELPDSVVH